jgi:hypothetical protein
VEAVATLESKPNRAQILRDSVEIRLAVNEAGPLIAEVLLENGITLPGVDWKRVFPHWLIATVEDEVIGCCQVAISKPVGYLEFLFVRKSAPFKVRAIAIRKLLIQGMSTLHTAGCQYVGGVVAAKNVKFAHVLEGLNFVKSFPADVHVKRLA